MTDRNGKTLAVGDRVFVLPDKETRTGGAGWVRRINGDRARVDDGPQTQADFTADGEWTWSAWVESSEVERLGVAV